MKNKYILGIFGIIILLAVIGYVSFNKNKVNPKLGGTVLSSLNQSPTIKTITVTTLEKGVFLKTSSDAPEVEVQDSASTSPGQIVSTSVSGRALIEWPLNHPTLLDYSSQVSIADTSDSNQNILELIGGEIWSRTENITEKSETFEIKTTNAVAVVRGTSFGLSFFNNNTTLLVADGSVSLYTKDLKTNEAELDTGVLLTAGKKGQVIGGGNPIRSQISNQDKMTPWFLYNTKGIKNLSPAPHQPTSFPANNTIKSTSTPSSNNSNPSNPVIQGGSMGSFATATTTTVSVFSPTNVLAGDNQTFVTITGVGFSDIMDLVIDENAVPDFEVTSDTNSHFHIGSLRPGVYSMYFVLKDGSIVTIPGSLTISSPTTRIQ